MKHSVKISVDVGRLEEDKDVKPQVINDLRAIGVYVDVKPLVREYLECFMRLHKTVRELVKDKKEDSHRTILDALDEYGRTFHEEPVPLGAFAINDEGKTLEEIPVFNQPIKRLELLVRKNWLITNLRLHFVTSEVGKP